MTEPIALYSHRGTRAVQRMVEYAPATGGLALWAAHRDLAADDAAALEPGAPPVSTDGHTLHYGAAFERLPLRVQAGWVAHEVLHIALRHAQRYLELQQLIGDVDLRLFNVCADAIVNGTLGHLGWLDLPAGAVQLDRLLAATLGEEQAIEPALLAWDVESLYRALDDRRPPRDGKREDGPRAARARAVGGTGATDLRPRPQQGEPPEAEAELAREWRERVVRAHAGDGEHSLLRALLADLPRTRTPWEQVLRTLLARSLAPRREVSWSRPSRSYLANQGRAGAHRRMPWEPGHSATKSVPRLVLMVDVSGSIDDALLQRFTREIDAIARRLETALVLVIGDDRVRRVEHIDPARRRGRRFELGELVFEGGGGTDFTPLLEEADRHRPDIGVFLTDLEGPARLRPRWPVIWAVPEHHGQAAAPFGRLLALR